MQIFEAPLREFRTKKAAEKFANSIAQKTFIEKGKSAFDMYQKKGMFKVFITEES